MMTTRFSAAVVILVSALSLACGDANTGPTSSGVVVEAVSATKVSGTVRTAVTPAPSVVVKDGSGRPISGVKVIFYVAGGGGTVSPGAAVTDKNGIAHVDQWILGPNASATDSGKANPNVLWALKAESTPYATFTAEALPGAPFQVISRLTPGNTLISGWPLTINTKVYDVYGNFIPHVPVAFAVTAGAGSIALDTVATDASGAIAIDWVLGLGANEATATVAGIPPDSVKATALDAAKITWYDLQPLGGNCAAVIHSSEIGLSTGGDIVTHTEYEEYDAVTAVGHYVVNGTSIWMSTSTIEIGTFGSDSITVTREGCDSDQGPISWIYRKRATGSP